MPPDLDMPVSNNRTNVSDRVFRVFSHIAVEDFEDSALVMDLRKQRLLRLNEQETSLLAQFSVQRTVAEVASFLADATGLSGSGALAETVQFCTHFHGEEILEEITQPEADSSNNITKEEQTIMDSANYMRNPDVVIREEDADGALLFNPDTGQIRLLNATGVAIWHVCDGNDGLEGIMTQLEQSFDDVPKGELRSDVLQFIDGLVKDGFIGVQEPPAGE